MRSDILKLRMIRDLTYHMEKQEELLTGYDFDMFWEILDQMSATRQQELWDLRKQKPCINENDPNAYIKAYEEDSEEEESADT